MSAAQHALEALNDVLGRLARVAVAVSGGVDSMTLAAVAHARLGANAEMFHAVSPAVPPEATARVERHAERRGWALTVIDAGEFADARYIANPVDRCFYCKHNLYASIAARTSHAVVSGTNTDDLGDYRPGLGAARTHGVRHPYVEAGIDKATVRAIARALELTDLAELPAAPCLSSRVETGIAIDAGALAAIHAVEVRARESLAPRTVRCRLRRDAIVIELDAETLAALAAFDRDVLAGHARDAFRRAGIERDVRFEGYRMGSAFLRGARA